jgi:RNA polymerase sigma-70 factor (ECF subfamily)
VRGHLQPAGVSETAELEQLVGAVARGERPAIARFFDRFEGGVNGLVWRMLGADADHDDIVNEAFTTMLKHVGEVQNAQALTAWVRSVTLNTLRMVVRRRRWRRFFTGSEEEALGYPDHSVPDEAERERARMLYRALSELPFTDRTALVLRHLEGMELTEVAESLGCSLATSKRHLARAEQRLATKLGGAFE